MSLQVNDPRSRTRSKSPGRSRERSRSRDSRAPDLLELEPPRSRQRSRSPAVEIAPKSSREYDLPRSRSPVVEIAPRSARPKAKSSREYDSDEETEIDRQYKLLKEGRLRAKEKEEAAAARILGPLE